MRKHTLRAVSSEITGVTDTSLDMITIPVGSGIFDGRVNLVQHAADTMTRAVVRAVA